MASPFPLPQTALIQSFAKQGDMGKVLIHKNSTHKFEGTPDSKSIIQRGIFKIVLGV